ncbi:MAG: M48 family metalloprotease [Acidobacteria bacterium]|nr:M48 family metalloprotease [Acidobacteriota bacterium]
MTRWICIFSVALLFTLSLSAQQTTDPATPAAQPGNSAPSSTTQTSTDQAVSTPASAPAPQQSAAGPATTLDQVVDRIIDREHALINFLQNRTPLVETYLQNLKGDAKFGTLPTQDHYFLGRLDMSSRIERRDYLHMQSSLLGGLSRPFRIRYEPLGFSWMIFADRTNFDRDHYDFHYLRREFLGDVRCVVFDVTPRPKMGVGLFEGRLWAEDENYNIVRLNGTYAPHPRGGYFFHMDSWRLNLVPGYWLPSYIFSEEGDLGPDMKDKLAFRAQTRLWGYNLNKDRHEEELTELKVDAVKDNSAVAQDATPLEAEREWEQQAEDNVLERLQAAGLLAPRGEVDKVLQTVANNILVTSNIDLPRPVRCRVMLTAPLETFSVGNTIVISRGLIDTLPDEASLAAILAHELGHIVLGHNVGEKFAFSDRLLFSDESVYRNFGFRHNPQEEADADAKGIEMLNKSPYAQKLASAGLYLKQLQERAPVLLALLTAHIGNSMKNDKGQIIRLTALLNSAPEIDDAKLDQIAALPIGGRIKLDPWTDRVEMLKAQPVAIISMRDKKPFGLTPFFPRLTRFGTTAPAQNPASAQNTGAGQQNQNGDTGR